MVWQLDGSTSLCALFDRLSQGPDPYDRNGLGEGAPTGERGINRTSCCYDQPDNGEKLSAEWVHDEH